MKLRTKLILAFLSIISIPVILVIIITALLSSYHLRSLQRSDNYNFFSDSTIQVFNAATVSVKEDIVRQIESDPDAFLDESYINGVNEQLQYSFTYIAVEKDGELYYNGLGSRKDEQVRSLFSEMSGTYDGDTAQMYTKIDKNSCLVDSWTLEFGDRTGGHVLLISFIGKLLPGIRLMLSQLLIVIVIIMVVIALLMFGWIYKTILRRIGELKKAANEIKNGNLDYELKVEGNDEIGMLCQDFEDMRLKLKETAEESVRSEAESKELISNISHDLKTPITAIKGYVEGIMDGVASSPEKLDKYIRTIYVKANDMDRLIDELTIYSKIDTNRIPYTFSKIDISEYFDDCVNELGIELESKGIILNFSNYLESSVTVIADSEQLKRVINNIVSNSVKYMDKPKGIINVRLKDVGDYVQIEIEDNGKGIAAKDMPYIFDRFYRADSSRNSAQGGSGIGLAIVKKIIEDHGGNIWATSKEGVGTVMYFVLRKHQEVIYEQNFNN
ncbi:MAG: HAMP domain-containing histidine kinase [Lachnospiraceae bacterium]|nr:HAMP domain-containing histidine kinase [Lachnospiraceae bacterium]